MICMWRRVGYNWYTECDHKYFAYNKDANPEIIDNKCPWCGKPISRIEVDDDEY